MNRNDLQRLAGTRIREAKTLFNTGEYSGAYYLAGYAAECALKSCYAKTVQRHDFPELRSRDVFTHNLQNLVGIVKLDAEFKRASAENGRFGAAWDIVLKWNEASRYREYDRNSAKALIDAVARPKEGVLPWIKRYW
jgi:HEPN domain-containing protein